MLFIEGTLDFPTEMQSEEIVNIVRDPNYHYAKTDLSSFDLNQDTEIRPALLDYCRFRVTPQLYVMDRLVGGLEVVRELHEQGNLKKLLEYVPTKTSDSIGARFKNRFKSSKNMVNDGDFPSPASPNWDGEDEIGNFNSP